MKVALLGYGKQGESAFTYWNRDGNTITICDLDKNLTLPQGVKVQLGEDYLQGLDNFDVIVRSPSIHPSAIVKANSPSILAKVTSVTNEFFKVCPSKNIIGITGTKGKGTTSTLIAKMLEAAGHRVILGGNIGIPPLDLLQSNIQSEDWVILELANFQLIDLQHSPHIAVCLMVVPEHLNWHKDFAEYIEAKAQLFKYQTEKDIAVYFADNQNSKDIASASHGQKIPYFASPGALIEGDNLVIDSQRICEVTSIRLLGKHNLQNVCAAVTSVWQVTQDSNAIRQVLQTFSGLEHRLELVREQGDVKYYDDSFGTTPETAIVAIEAINQPKIVIFGGSEKNSDYQELAKITASSNVRDVVLIGETGPAIKEALIKAGYTAITDGGSDMTTIVKTAASLARPGDAVLLSTACASFDLFKNYEDRGQQFKQAVQALV